MAKHNKIGQIGEALAKEYLEKRGYEILEQNYRTPRSEIDLVVQKNGICIFIEVRTKIGEQFGSPEDTINKQKLRKVRKNAEAYIARENIGGACRIDAVCVVLTPFFEQERVTHYENIA